MDFEEHNQAEASLKATDHDHRSIIENIPGMVTIYTAEGNLDYANRLVLEFLGVPFHKLIESGCVCVSHPDDVSRVAHEWSRCISTGITFHSIHRWRRSDGSFVWVSDCTQPLRNNVGQVTGWYGLIINVDDHQKAEEALRESDHRFRLMIDTIPAQVWCATPEGGPAFINKRMADYTGITVEQSVEVGAHSHDDAKALSSVLQWREMMHPDDFDSVLPTWTQCLDTGDPYDVQFRLKRFDGVYRWFHVRGEPFRDNSGAILSWYGLNIDVDDKRRVELELRTTQTRLARASQIATIAELSASIAHEINQPLAAVIVNGESCLSWLAASPPNASKARLSVERIIRDANSAAEVIRRIRALFKHAPPAKASLNLNEVILEVLSLLTDKTSRMGTIIDTDLMDDLPCALADRIQIQQVMVNLIQNAAEAMEEMKNERKLLTIHSKRHGDDDILIEIEDCGCGLEDADKIFEPFFTTKENGMGIGLSICQSIIEAHQGRLWADSSLDKGTTFKFTLPIVQRID